jgi:hypothetical protein
MLAHWATPHFRRTVRSDIELSDDPEDLMEDFGRYSIMSFFTIVSSETSNHTHCFAGFTISRIHNQHD